MAHSHQTKQAVTNGSAANRGAEAYHEGLRTHMLSVFNWMGAGLATSAVTAYLIATQPGIQEMFFTSVMKDGVLTQELSWLAIMAFIAPFGLILLMGARMHSMSPASAQKMLIGLCACMGVVLAPVAMNYTTASLAQTFFVTASTFAVTSIYGYTTNADLTRLGNMLLMALFGLIVAGLVGIGVGSSAADMAISVVGVLVFVAFTAYDTQRIKLEYLQRACRLGDEMEAKFAVLDALAMYLNFVNLFLYMLRFMGVKTGSD